MHMSSSASLLVCRISKLPPPQLRGLKTLPCTPLPSHPPPPPPRRGRPPGGRGPPPPPPATPCRQRQYYYRKRKGHHLQRFRGHPGLQAEREEEERAEEERAGDRP